MHDSTENPSVATIERRRMLVLTVAFEGGLLVLAGLLGWLLDVPFWRDLQPHTLEIVYGIALSVPLTAGVIWIVETSWRPFRQIRKDLEKVVKLLQDCTVADLFVIALLAGVCEEALFRGFLQQYLSGITGPVLGLLITSAIFGLIHAVSLLYVVFVSLIGLFLGLLYIWTDSLVPPILVHFLYDFAALVYGIHLRPIQGRIAT